MNRIFAIGDIHGCLEKLETLMQRINIDWETDRLLFIGDYIDRGPSSYGVVDYLVHLRQQHPEIIFLKGNHESMLENYLNGTNRMNYLINGGRKTLEEYLANHSSGDPDPIPEDHKDFFESLLLYYETGDYIFVHAGLRDKIPLERQNPEDLLWIRNPFLKSRYDFGKPVVFGHTPFTEPFIRRNKIGIDTGAVYGRKLTCIKLPDLEFISA
jgi:serine/threonine protein phosphatase 1